MIELHQINIFSYDPKCADQILRNGDRHEWVSQLDVNIVSDRVMEKYHEKQKIGKLVQLLKKSTVN